MFSNSSGLSPSDVLALNGAQGNSGFGGEGSWLWFLIVVIALFGGWGNGNGVFGSNGSSGAAENYVLSSDFATLQRMISDGDSRLENKLDGVDNGICSLGYDQQAQMNGINQNVSTTGFAIQNAITQDTIANMQNTNAIGTQITALGTQMQTCCCENRANVADLKYTMATDTCSTNTNIQTAARDITDNANANTKAILDFLVNDKLQTLESQNAELRLAASQQAQNNYLVSQLRPSPIPAYTVANPYGYYYGYGTTIS